VQIGYGFAHFAEWHEIKVHEKVRDWVIQLTDRDERESRVFALFV
jgi:hypothetical protein